MFQPPLHSRNTTATTTTNNTVIYVKGTLYEPIISALPLNLFWKSPAPAVYICVCVCGLLLRAPENHQTCCHGLATDRAGELTLQLAYMCNIFITLDTQKLNYSLITPIFSLYARYRPPDLPHDTTNMVFFLLHCLAFTIPLQVHKKHAYTHCYFNRTWPLAFPAGPANLLADLLDLLHLLCIKLRLAWRRELLHQLQ